MYKFCVHILVCFVPFSSLPLSSVISFPGSRSPSSFSHSSFSLISPLLYRPSHPSLSLYPILHPFFLPSLPLIFTILTPFSSFFSPFCTSFSFSLSLSHTPSIAHPSFPSLYLSFFFRRFLAPPHTCKSVHLSSAPYHIIYNDSHILHHLGSCETVIHTFVLIGGYTSIFQIYNIMYEHINTNF